MADAEMRSTLTSSRFALVAFGIALRAAAGAGEPKESSPGDSRVATPVEIAAVPNSGLTAVVQVQTPTVISHQPNYYHGWPTLVRRANGALLVVYSGGRDYHVCPFGRVESMISTDEGETWSWPRIINDSIIDDRDSGVVETRSGVLLASFFTSIAYQVHMNAPEKLLAGAFGSDLEPTLARWRSAERGLTQAERKADLGPRLSQQRGAVGW